MAFLGTCIDVVREVGWHGALDIPASDADDDHKIVPGDISVKIYATIIMDRYFLITFRRVVALAAAVGIVDDVMNAVEFSLMKSSLS